MEQLCKDYTFDPTAVLSDADVTGVPVQHTQVDDTDTATEPSATTVAMETLIETETVGENEVAVSQIEAAVAGDNVQTLELQADQIAQLLANQGGVLNSDQVVYLISG